MKTYEIAVLSVLSVSGCGIGVDRPEQVSQTEAQEQSLTTSLVVPRAPSTPSSPTPFRTQLAKTPLLYPLGVGSAYTVIWEDPKDSRYFLAIGYDVWSRRNVFYVRGSIANDYGAAMRNLAASIENNSMSNPTYHGDGIIGGIFKGPKGPSPGVPQEVWAKAFQIAQLQ